LYNAFQSFEGLVGARVVTDRNTDKSRGFGYVDFSSSEYAEKALTAMHETDLEGRSLNLDFSMKKSDFSGPGNDRDRANSRAKARNDSLSAPSDTLFVGNLPFDVDQDTVRDFFSDVAEVSNLRLPTDP
jgi:nucleolin